MIRDTVQGKRLMPILMFIVAIFLIPGLASATTYYVATNGSDSNPGTAVSPFKTIKKGVAILSAGDTLYVKSGTYGEALFSWQTTTIPNGESWSKPITVAAYPGDSVTINPVSGGAFFWIKDGMAKYLIVDGFIIDGKNQALHGFKFHGGTSHVRVQNSEIKNSTKSGIIVTVLNSTIYGAPNDTYHEFINLHVHHNGTDVKDHGFYIETSRNLVERCDLHHNSANGGKFFMSQENGGGGTANYNILRNNITHDNGTNTTQHAVGFLLGSGQGNQAYGNIAYNQDTGFAIGNDAVKNLLYNNISYNNRYYGINVYGAWGGSDTAMVFNNTVYQNGLFGIAVRDGAKDTIIQNNISYKNGSDASKNIWLHPDMAPGTVTEKNLTVDPHFMNPLSYDFKLQPTSQAIDTGLTIPVVKVDFFDVKRPQGKAYDIGAIEHETLADSTAPAAPKEFRVAN